MPDNFKFTFTLHYTIYYGQFQVSRFVQVYGGWRHTLDK